MHDLADSILSYFDLDSYDDVDDLPSEKLIVLDELITLAELYVASDEDFDTSLQSCLPATKEAWQSILGRCWSWELTK